MDFTIRFITDDGRDELIPANGKVVLIKQDSPAFKEMVNAKKKDCPDFMVKGLRAFLSYHCYDYNGELYVYDEDRVFIMNGNGNTVNAI